MNTKPSIPNRAIVKVALFALLFSFGTSMAQAVQKYRGHIKSVDLAAQTMVLDHKKGDLTLKWDDRTEMTNGSFEELAPGQWVRNIMNEPEDGFIRLIRRFPNKDL